MNKLIIYCLISIVFFQCSYKISSKDFTTVKGFIVVDSRNAKEKPDLESDLAYFILINKKKHKDKFKTKLLGEAYLINKHLLGLNTFKDKFKRICDDNRCIDYFPAEITCRALLPLKKEEYEIIIHFESKEVKYILKAQYLIISSVKSYPYDD